MAMSAQKQLPPSAQDAAIARVSGELLARYARKRQPLTLRVPGGEQDRPLELPAGAVTLLMDILEAMAAGRGVAVVAEDAELTTVEAANALNVSRTFLIKLLDEAVIPHRKVGKHRRIRAEDVAAYKARDDRERDAILDQLVSEAQERNMGY